MIAMDKLRTSAKRRLRELPAIKAIANGISKRRFKVWKSKNPGGTFGEYYAAKTIAGLKEGRSHYTLGGRGKTKGHTARIDWTPEDFAKRSLDIWEAVRGFGLTPEMKCVDYGCGSLRIGQHAMRFLDSGNYCGMDVVDTFINQGLELVDPDVIAEKMPELLVISPQSLDKIRAWRPDFIFSSAVIQHVPPEELEEFFRCVERLMIKRCTAHVIYISAPRMTQVKALNWVYPAEFLLAAMNSAAPGLTLIDDRALPELGTVEGRTRHVLHIAAR